MEKDNKNIKKTDQIDEVDLGGRVGIIKKIFIFLFILVIIILIGLLSLQRLIRLESTKAEHIKEISEILIEETNKLNTEENKNDRINASLKIKGNALFRSFLSPHILITGVEGKNLVENNYIVDFKMEKIRLFLSSEHLLKKEFVVDKIEIINGNFSIKELNKDIEIKIVKRIIDKYFAEITKKQSNIKISLKNSSIIVNAVKYKRELTNINVLGVYSKNGISLSGKLASNRQPLDININLKKSKDNLDGKINLSSQAFIINTSVNINPKNLNFSGSSNLNLINPQIFSRTLFNTSDFLYKRIIDNTSLEVKFEFSFENNIFDIKNIIFNGQNIKGNGKAQFNFTPENKNTINFDIETINIDAIIIKNIVSKTSGNIKENDISIFSGANYTGKSNSYRSFIENKLKINPTFFNIKLKEIQFNSNKITDTELDFSYSDGKGYNFNKVVGNLPGETNLTIENKNNTQLLNIKGNDITGFWNFLRNTAGVLSQTPDDKKIKFNFDGIVKTDGDRIFITDANFSAGDFKSQNTVEIKFDSGISFIAIDTKIDNLVLDNINFKKEEASYLYSDMLKNRILFLNTFAINTFLKFEIKNIQNGDFKDTNYNFTIRTSQGVLNIYNINLNNKISGGIIFNILQSKPRIDMKLNIENINIENNIDLNKILFDLPTFEDFYGNMNITGNNILFKKSTINKFDILANLQNGTINFSKFDLDGFGGKCKIGGFLDMQYSKKLNLTFGGCTADLKDLLYLFTGTNNISGIIGFSSVLYAEGQNIETFIQSYIVKLQMIASGITINGFGLEDLSNDLFDINSNEELLNSMDPEAILYDKDSKTIFEKMSKGSIQYSKKNGGQFDFDLTRLMINGKINGKFEMFPNYLNLELNSNFVMLSGVLEKIIPLNLAIAINGNTSEKMGIATNFQNIDSYISSIKKQYEELKKQNEENEKNQVENEQLQTQ